MYKEKFHKILKKAVIASCGTKSDFNIGILSCNVPTTYLDHTWQRFWTWRKDMYKENIHKILLFAMIVSLRKNALSWKLVRSRLSVVCDQICLPIYRNGTSNCHFIRVTVNNQVFNELFKYLSGYASPMSNFPFQSFWLEQSKLNVEPWSWISFGTNMRQGTICYSSRITVTPTLIPIEHHICLSGVRTHRPDKSPRPVYWTLARTVLFFWCLILTGCELW